MEKQIKVKGIKMFPKMRKTESNNMVAKDIKISQEMKNESYLSIEKNKKYGKNKKCLTNKD